MKRAPLEVCEWSVFAARTLPRGAWRRLGLQCTKNVELGMSGNFRTGGPEMILDLR